MKKRIAALLLALTVVFLMGCGGEKKEEVKDVNFYDLRTAMLNATDKLPEMQTASSVDDNASELLAYVSDIDYKKVSNFFVSYSKEGLADEIVVISVKDEADVKEAKDSLQKHLEHRKNLFANYAIEQASRLDSAILKVSGRYVVLIIADEYSKIDKAFDDMLKEN
ncbi:MAG: DUF4358 domain-containing protein [Lachnospiraceae bacterium]|nr:DUF4358 domain-containing protein [Lachnospiraceae bacterium]